MVIDLLICIFGIPTFLIYLLVNKIKDNKLNQGFQNDIEELHKFDREVVVEPAFLNELRDVISLHDYIGFYENRNLSSRDKMYFDSFKQVNKDRYDRYCKYYPEMKAAFCRAEREIGIKLKADTILQIYLASIGKINLTSVNSAWQDFPFGIACSENELYKITKWMDREITKRHPQYYLYATKGYVGTKYKWNFAMHRDDYKNSYRLN